MKNVVSINVLNVKKIKCAVNLITETTGASCEVRCGSARIAKMTLASTEDDVWKNIDPDDIWVLDKLILSRKLGYNC